MIQIPLWLNSHPRAVPSMLRRTLDDMCVARNRANHRYVSFARFSIQNFYYYSILRVFAHCPACAETTKSRTPAAARAPRAMLPLPRPRPRHRCRPVRHTRPARRVRPRSTLSAAARQRARGPRWSRPHRRQVIPRPQRPRCSGKTARTTLRSRLSPARARALWLLDRAMLRIPPCPPRARAQGTRGKTALAAATAALSIQVRSGLTQCITRLRYHALFTVCLTPKCE
jgi:hypothetical protein